MDIYSLLRQDHQHILELFAGFDAIDEDKKAEKRQRLFETLKRDIARHKEAEERSFYAALSALPETAERIEEALEEHADIEELLDEFDSIDIESDTFTAQLAELREEVEHHIEEVENVLFDRARELLTDEQAERLGQQMEAAKARLAG